MRRNIFLVVAMGLCTLFVGGLGWYKWNYPHGPKTCRLPCMMGALISFAQRNDDWFPQSQTTNSPLDALKRLVPMYSHGNSLAGLSGDEEAVESRLTTGQSLDDLVSSWTYWPGFRYGDPAELAIIWDRTAGINGIGQRSSAGSHAVGFADGTHKQISGENWQNFLEGQFILRSNILSRRRELTN